MQVGKLNTTFKMSRSLTTWYSLRDFEPCLTPTQLKHRAKRNFRTIEPQAKNYMHRKGFEAKPQPLGDF